MLFDPPKAQARDRLIGVQVDGKTDCSLELLARNHLRHGRYCMEDREHVRVVASAAANARGHFLLVVLQRQSYVIRYKCCFGMPRLAEVIQQGRWR
jgi:hypothetical protein